MTRPFMIYRPDSSIVSSKTSLDEEDNEFDDILTFIFDLFVELILFVSQMEESTTTPPVRKYNLYFLFYYMKLSSRNFAILRFCSFGVLASNFVHKPLLARRRGTCSRTTSRAPYAQGLR